MRAIGSIWTATFNFMSWFRMASSRAGVEGRHKMARQAARRNQHGVEAQIIPAMFGVRHQPGFRSRNDACLLARRDRISRLIERLARLDLDKGDGVAPPRHDID